MSVGWAAAEGPFPVHGGLELVRVRWPRGLGRLHAYSSIPHATTGPRSPRAHAGLLRCESRQGSSDRLYPAPALWRPSARSSLRPRSSCRGECRHASLYSGDEIAARSHATDRGGRQRSRSDDKTGCEPSWTGECPCGRWGDEVEAIAPTAVGARTGRPVRTGRGVSRKVAMAVLS